MHINRILLVFSTLLLSSCQTETINKDMAFLHNKCIFGQAGDIGDNDPYSGNFLKDLPGFVDYAAYFNKDKTFLNMECKVNDRNVPYGEGELQITLMNGRKYHENFIYSGVADLYYATFTSKTLESNGDLMIDYNNIIYCHTPYWTRITFRVILEDLANEVNMTIQFYKGADTGTPDIFKSKK